MIWLLRSNDLFPLSYPQGNISCAILGFVARRKDTREIISLAGRALKVVALDIFAKSGWRSNNRLCLRLFPFVCVTFSFISVTSVYADNIART
jgi:hypothetical protein